MGRKRLYDPLLEGLVKVSPFFLFEGGIRGRWGKVEEGKNLFMALLLRGFLYFLIL